MGIEPVCKIMLQPACCVVVVMLVGCSPLQSGHIVGMGVALCVLWWVRHAVCRSVRWVRHAVCWSVLVQSRGVQGVGDTACRGGFSIVCSVCSVGGCMFFLRACTCPCPGLCCALVMPVRCQMITWMGWDVLHAADHGECIIQLCSCR